MIAATVTKNFGLIAADSAQYDTTNSQMSFQTSKLFFTKRSLITFIGTPVYFSKIDKSKFDLDFQSVCLYLKDYLQGIKPEVLKMLKSEIADPEDRTGHFCLFIMGIHKKLPTLAQFNNFLNFEPKYLYSDDKPKFSTIFYGDDSPEKKNILLESTAYMEHKTRKLAKKGTELTPGVLGEVLIRGIYKKVDLEVEKPPHIKYAGGVVSVAGMASNGVIFPLSRLEPA